MFGGKYDDEYNNRLVAFNSSVNTEVSLSPNFVSPKNRKSQVFVAIEESLIMFGGDDGTAKLNDMWQFTTTSAT